MTRAVFASLLASFVAAGVILFSGTENAGLAIVLGALIALVVLIVMWLWRSRHPLATRPQAAPAGPIFDATFDWEQGVELVLQLVVRNVGTARGSVQAAYFRTQRPDPPGGWHEWDIEPLQEAAGVVLDANEVTRPIRVELARMPPGYERLPRLLVAGEAELILVSAQGEVQIAVPPSGQGPPPPTLEELRD